MHSLYPSHSFARLGYLSNELVQRPTSQAELNLIGLPATDISLLLIMLVGLFRLRSDGIGIVGLAQVLWKQVILVLASRGSLNPLILFCLRGGDPLASACYGG